MTPVQIALRALLVGFVVVLTVITGFAYGSFLERKLLARFQGRVGPNRAGYIPIPQSGRKEKKLLGGVLQPAADAVKLFFKEDVTPSKADRRIYTLAPMMAAIPAILILGVIPWAGEITIFGSLFSPYFAIAPGINVAVLFILSLASIGVYGVVLAGWSSNSKYAVLGGIRTTAQMVSYELALGLSILVPVMMANSLDLGEIVEAQRGGWFFVQFVAAFIFFVATLAEMQRSPFDLLEAEQELSAGYMVEYGGMRFGMFFMSEYMAMISYSAIMATLFFGGYRGPFVDTYPALGFLYIMGKTLIGVVLMIWIRATLPRFRYDQLMSFGWKSLLPISALNFILTATFILLKEEGIVGPFIDSVLKFFVG